MYAVIDSVAKIAAMGGDYRKIRLTFQEYFEKLGDDPSRWGKPMAALLGALRVQEELEIPSIGGKDSMSGTFMDIDVPPTLVSFAITSIDAGEVVSSEFKKAGSTVAVVTAPIDKKRNNRFRCIQEKSPQDQTAGRDGQAECGIYRRQRRTLHSSHQDGCGQ